MVLAARCVFVTATLCLQLVRFRPTLLTRWQGRFNGGNGVHREFHFTKDCKTFLIGERRVTRPYGMEGGEPGQSGAHYWMRKNRDGTLRKVNLGPRGTFLGTHSAGFGVYSSVIVTATINVLAGESIIIHTPVRHHLFSLLWPLYLCLSINCRVAELGGAWTALSRNLPSRPNRVVSRSPSGVLWAPSRRTWPRRTSRVKRCVFAVAHHACGPSV